MAVILDDDALPAWLSDEDDIPLELLQSMCKPFDASRMSAYEVSPIVNSVSNNTAACLERFSIEQPALLAFE